VVSSRVIMTSDELSPQLKEFIDRIIVPVLVREWLKEEQVAIPRVLPTAPLSTETTEESA
jgi:hypothetical protein